MPWGSWLRARRACGSRCWSPESRASSLCGPLIKRPTKAASWSIAPLGACPRRGQRDRKPPASPARREPAEPRLFEGRDLAQLRPIQRELAAVRVLVVYDQPVGAERGVRADPKLLPLVVLRAPGHRAAHPRIGLHRHLAASDVHPDREPVGLLLGKTHHLVHA